MKPNTFLMTILTLGLTIGAASAQTDAVPTFKAEVVARTVPAINYKVLGGETKLDFTGTANMPAANGEAKVSSQQAYNKIEAKFEKLGSPTQFGAEYLTYVLWAISPEGRVANLGELLLDKNGKAELEVTTDLAVFGLIVTAEPYFAVRQPTDVIVLQNDIQKKVKGRVFFVDAKTELLKKGEYAKLANPLGMTPDLKAQPLEMYEARNAIHIAEAFKAGKYSNDTLDKAKSSLTMASNAMAAKKDRKEIITFARESVQFAEEARALSVVRQDEEMMAATKAKSEADAKARAAAEAARASEEKARAAAEKAKMEAELEAAKAAQRRAEAEAAKAAALAAQQASAAEAAKSAAEAAKAKEAAQSALAEKAELRKRLLAQFNSILETTDTERGLVVNIGDVLFDVGKADLKADAKLKLARFAGIVLNYPNLKLAMDGHTDNTGTDAINEKLSQARADAVRDFLGSQGLNPSSMTSTGRSSSMPVAPNDTADGRKKNRRVEITVSGEVIGEKIG